MTVICTTRKDRGPNFLIYLSKFCYNYMPYHSVWRMKVFWTWLEEMFIFSNIRGDISLLNVYRGAAIIEVYLWSKKSAT